MMVAPATTRGESVAIRVTGGRFLGAAESGVAAGRCFPYQEETFELVPRGQGQFALKAHAGRFLIAAEPTRVLHAASSAKEPGPQETFTLMPIDGNRVALKTADGRFVRFLPAVLTPGAPATTPANTPSDAETAEIYRVLAIPEALRTTLSSVIGTVASEELKGKEYDKTRTRRKEQRVELPAPTLRDLKRRKKRRFWSMTEEYQVKAKLDGEPQIELKQLAFLDGYQQRGTGRLMFALEAQLPAQGQVHYRLSELLSATTNFRVTIHLAAIGEVGAKKSDSKLPFGPPELVALRVQISQLDISNDLLNVGREPIEDLVNHELRDNENRIREKANTSVRKALEKHPVRLPLLRYLGFPLG